MHASGFTSNHRQIEMIQKHLTVTDSQIINIWVSANSPTQIWANLNNLIKIWVELEIF